MELLSQLPSKSDTDISCRSGPFRELRNSVLPHPVAPRLLVFSYHTCKAVSFQGHSAARAPQRGGGDVINTS